MMQIFNLIFLFVAFCLEGVHHNPVFKIITLFDGSEKNAAAGAIDDLQELKVILLLSIFRGKWSLILKLFIGKQLCLPSFCQTIPQ